MKTLFINGQKYTYDKIVSFKTDTNLIECFFFKNEVFITSQFLTLFELLKMEQNTVIHAVPEIN